MARNLGCNWSKACKDILLLQPSTTAAKCDFSILSNPFSDRQKLVLKVYIETSVMLQILCRSALLHHVLVKQLEKLAMIKE